MLSRESRDESMQIVDPSDTSKSQPPRPLSSTSSSSVAVQKHTLTANDLESIEEARARLGIVVDSANNAPVAGHDQRAAVRYPPASTQASTSQLSSIVIPEYHPAHASPLQPVFSMVDHLPPSHLPPPPMPPPPGCIIHPMEAEGLDSFFQSELLQSVSRAPSPPFVFDDSAFLMDGGQGGVGALNMPLINEAELSWLNQFLDVHASASPVDTSASAFNQSASSSMVFDHMLFPSVPHSNSMDMLESMHNIAHQPLIGTGQRVRNNSSVISSNSSPVDGTQELDEESAPVVVEKKHVHGTVPLPVLAPRKKRHRSKALLTDEEKRANHIASEQKRRKNIRAGFKALTMLVPSLSYMTSRYCSESEANDEDDSSTSCRKKARVRAVIATGDGVAPSKGIVLTKSIDYLEYLLARNQKLKERADMLRRKVEDLPVKSSMSAYLPTMSNHRHH